MRIKEGQRFPFYMGLCYKDGEEGIFLPVPINFIVRIALILYVKAMYAFKKPSWFDRQLTAAHKNGFNMGYKQALNDAQKKSIEKRYLSATGHDKLIAIKNIN